MTINYTPPSMKRMGRPPNARIPSPAPRPADPTDGTDPTMEVGEPRLRRQSRRQDKFHIPPEIIPDGWSYEWKRQSCYGQPDPDHQINLRANHWRSVPSDRHPQLMPDGHTGAITKDGQILMERPAYLTEEARQEDYEIAMGEVARKEAQLGHTPPNTFTRDHESARRVTRVRRTYGPMTVEE